MLILLFHFPKKEEDPGWYSRVSNFVPEPDVDVEINVSAKKYFV